MPINVEVQGLDGLEKAGQLSRSNRVTLMQNLIRAAGAFGRSAVGTTQKDYLSGPRPTKLGTVTNRLRSSITTKTETSGNVIETSVGTNVKYAAIHEFGGQIQATPSMYGFFWAKFYESKDVKWKRMALGLKRKGHINIPARPFLRPGVMDSLPIYKRNIERVLAAVSLTGPSPEFQA